MGERKAVEDRGAVGLSHIAMTAVMLRCTEQSGDLCRREHKTGRISMLIRTIELVVGLCTVIGLTIAGQALRCRRPTVPASSQRPSGSSVHGVGGKSISHSRVARRQLGPEASVDLDDCFAR